MMKKILLALMLTGAALTASAQYQFPNSDFESAFIGAGGNYTEPEGWHGYATIDATGLNTNGRSGEKLKASTDVRPGSTGKQSVYVKATAIVGVVANGVMTNGQIYTHSTTATDGSQNYNFSQPGNVIADYAPNSQFYTPFTGKPDAMRVWLKNMGTGTARVCVWLHTAGRMCDPTKNTDMSIVCANAVAPIPNNKEWTQYDIPFSYAGFNGKSPEYILATFTTNETPGAGKDGDQLFIDDIEMIYWSDMRNVTYAGKPVTFDANNTATVNAAYNAKLLKYTTGAGAAVTTNVTEDGTVTFTIQGQNISEQPDNHHTYTLHFTKGVDAGLDDEPLVTVTPETSAVVTTFGTGVYYISANGKYLDEDQQLNAPDAQKNGRLLRWTVTGTPGNYQFQNDGQTYSSGSGQYLYLSRAKSSSSPSMNAWSSAPSATKFVVEGADGLWSIGIEGYQYYDGVSIFGVVLGAASGDFYLMPKDASLTWTQTKADGTKWLFEDADMYKRVNEFWPNYTNATISQSISAAAFVQDGVTTKSLPLGIYTITGEGSLSFAGKTYTASSGTFYVPSSTSVTFNGTPNLSYYGRLNFDLTTATFDGKAIQEGAVNAVYDPQLFACTATGNGVQNIEKYFDESTNELTVTVSGYGRSREHVFQFAEPDLSLSATWYGQKVEDGAIINEAYNAEKLVVTPGMGATAKVDFVESTGVATITISSSTASESYTLQFAVYPEASGAAVTYQPVTVLKNGVSAAAAQFVVTPLEGGAIRFAVQNATFGITAQNLSVAGNGSFSYAGELRASDEKLYPVTIYGHLDAEGQLLDACVDYAVAGTELWHNTYGLTTTGSKDYSYDIVVTINGDATTIPANTITVGELTNGNINFTLKEFKMNLGGSDAYIGNIFLENLSVDAEGNFSFDGGLLIGPGTDASKQYGGLGLGIVPVKLRGQRFNDGDDLLVVIDIDMQESIQQTIHVTLGADAVSTARYKDTLYVSINGETTDVPNTYIEIGTLKNDNITFTLENFTMSLNGEPAPIGNVTIDNIALDDKGNFTYQGVIRIGKGTDATKTWGGPELGDVPVVIRGSVFDYTSIGNCVTRGLKRHCQLVLDIDMQESIQQTIHVTYGLTTVSTKDYTDVLAVTVNGETSRQDATVTVSKLRNDNINFTLNNFVLADGTIEQPIGNIALENLILDETGHFSYEGTVRIGKGSDESKTWGGPELGDVPLIVNGLVTDKGMVFNIDIDMEAQLGQTINVTFGATPLSTTDFTDDLKVTINGEAAQTTATITMGELKADGFYSFSLNNFSLPVNGETLYVGNIAINALELDTDGKFSYNGKIRIGEGTLAEVETWAGPELGAIPMQLKGQRYVYNGTEYLLVSIAIDMQESIGQTIDVLFGGTPIRSIALRDNLKVSVNGDENTQKADVTVGILRNGHINFTLRNFILKMIGESGAENNIPVGNLSIDNLEMDTKGRFSYNGILRVGNGDDSSISEWGGPALGNIPVELSGSFRENGDNSKAYVTIDIWMESLQQTIKVIFGEPLGGSSIGDLVHKIAEMKAGNATKADVLQLVNEVLGK